ncbi:MAG: tetratricopeptide repeat protein, partial [Proteobacteria bacterium]|nr:tetratricopeptide repeat protein [Pseudomonadota bacterium]
MNLWFYAIAALMLVAALACVAAPLLRAGRRAGRARAPFVLALALVFALPLAAIGLYVLFGAPQALQPRPANAVDLAQATDELRARLQSSPDHPEGWVLLAQAYASMGRLNDARDAFGQALKLKPGDPDLMVAYVEADAQARTDHRIDDESRKLLERALTLQPDHQRGLWLLGISDYQLGRFGEAASHWQRLLALLPPDSKLASAVSAQIAMAMAQARAQGKTQEQAEALAPA